MSDTRPMTKEDIVDLLIANGKLHPSQRDKVLRGEISTPEEQAEYQKSPFYRMLKSRMGMEQLDWPVDGPVPEKYTR